jgi:hypothetical protein
MAKTKTTKPKTAGKVTTSKAAAGKAKVNKTKASKAKTSKAAESPPTDEVLSEIEDHLLSYAYNRRSPATDREGKAWRTVAFSGPHKILAKLVKHPVAQKLETLTIVDVDTAIRVLAGGPPLAALRELRLGSLPEGQSELVGFEERNCGDLTALSRACPRLEILRLRCPGFVAGDHPTLRVLDARMGARPASVASLAKASLPSLKELHLGFEVETDEPLYSSLFWSPRTLEPLFDAKALPTLRRLCLWPMPEDDGLFKLAKASPLGKRVKIKLLSVDEDLEDAYTL